MNILYIAYSCNPFQGSEDKIGWNVPVESAKTNKVYVISKEEQRKPVEKYLSEHDVKNIEFFFVDIPSFYKKIFSGFMYSGRLNIWNKRAFQVAKRICIDKKIDIIHQITPVEFRAIGDYGKIQNTKFVCGPLGGAEKLPKELKDYAKGHAIVEIVRLIINYCYKVKLRITGKFNDCNYLMFANKETLEFVGKHDQINRKPMTEIAVDQTEISKKLVRNKLNQGKCIFLVAGRMIYRKGIDLLLDALMRVPENFEYEVRIVGEGPELEHLKKRCVADNNLSKHVRFTGSIPYSEIEKQYEEADVFIMPSIRETTGTVLLESMARSVPVITINKFGGAILLDDSTGWLYEGDSKESYINNLKDKIIMCVSNRKEIEIRGENARKKAEMYTWQEKNKKYQEIYKNIMK